jgi:hypothetical protein
VGVIILAVIAHQLPKMMAGMVTEGGYSGHVGDVGVTTVLDAAVAGSSIAQAVAAGGTDSAAAETAMDSYRKLMDRIGLVRWISEEIAGRSGVGADRYLQIRDEKERM